MQVLIGDDRGGIYNQHQIENEADPKSLRNLHQSNQKKVVPHQLRPDESPMLYSISQNSINPPIVFVVKSDDYKSFEMLKISCMCQKDLTVCVDHVVLKVILFMNENLSSVMLFPGRFNRSNDTSFEHLVSRLIELYESKFVFLPSCGEQMIKHSSFSV